MLKMQQSKSSRIVVTEERISTYNRSTSGEQNKRQMKIAVLLSILGALLAICLAFLIYKDIISLHPKSMKPEALKSFVSKLEYTVRYQALLACWLLFAVFATMFGRAKNKALNPLELGTEGSIQSYKNILQNSLEQIVIAVLGQFAFISYAEPSTVLKFIPLINILLLIGRIAFFVGYPLKRGVGMGITTFINTALIIYVIYRLGSTYFI